MNICIDDEKDKFLILKRYPYTSQVIGDNGVLIVAKNDIDIVGFAWGFIRTIPAPIDKNELFLNAIEVFDIKERRKGIASEIIKSSIDYAKKLDIYQIRAYVDINNTASHKLWLKNNFGISPVKDRHGIIPGSFVTFVL